MFELTLPYPPSCNTYYRSPNSGPLAGRHLLSERGRAYREIVRGQCLQRGLKPAMERLSVKLIVYPPDNRRRDLDNVCKGSLDALTFGGAWLDDSQIDELHLIRGPVIKGGQLRVIVHKFDGSYPRLLDNAAFLQGAAQQELPTE